MVWYSNLFQNFPQFFLCYFIQFMEFDFEGQWDLIAELPQDWGKRLMAGTTKPMCSRTQEKVTMTPQETEPDMAVSVWESLAEFWVSGLPWGQGH